MTFEEAAALKILFGSEEVQVITENEPCDEGGDSPDPPGVIVRNHGIINHDHLIWDVAAGIRELAEMQE